MDDVKFNGMLDTDVIEIDKIFEAVKALSVDYLDGINERRPTLESASHTLPALPEIGLGTLNTQALFEKNFLPNIVASSGPRYWGFVTGGTTPAAIAGDWLTSVFDQNTQSLKGAGDVSAMLEVHTVKMLLELFGLPDTFIGGMVTGATMSNFTGLAVARQWIGKQKGIDIAREGVPAGIKIYAATPHSSAVKSLSMLGLGSSNIQLVPTLPDRECMDIAALEKKISVNKAEPFILIASGGTVNTVDFDDMQKIAALKQAYNFWWHIDAAFGGFAACTPSYAHLLNGWEDADSITIDNHKWLNVPYDSALILTKKAHASLQVQTFQNSNAPYLGDPLENFNYLNYGPENSRRFRALPVWFTLMAYGKKGYRQLVEGTISLAQKLGKAISELKGFELAAPVRLNTVCFTVSDIANRNDKVNAVLQALQKSGKVFMTPTIYKGISCIRAALVNWRTSEADIAIAIEELSLVSGEL